MPKDHNHQFDRLTTAGAIATLAAISPPAAGAAPLHSAFTKPRHGLSPVKNLTKGSIRQNSRNPCLLVAGNGRPLTFYTPAEFQ